MSYILFLFSLLPSFSLNLGFGGIPLRYLALPGLLFPARVNKESIYILVAVLFHLFWVLFASPFGRKFHLLDISYILTYLYTFLCVVVCYNNSESVKKYVIYFFYVNIFYAVIQNIALNAGVPSQYLLLHQNTHAESYSIPNSIIPIFWRVTGLFNESVPYVLYLSFSMLFFFSIGHRIKGYLAAIFILTSGAKSALLILTALALSRFFSRIKLYMLIPAIFTLLLFLLVFYAPDINDYLLSEPALFSIYLRVVGILSTVVDFGGNIEVFFFGSGFVSSSDLMTKGLLAVERGTDYFSLYIYSNGVFGTLLLNLPFYWYLKQATKRFSCNEINKISIVLFFSLMLSGSYTLYVYSYFIMLCTLIDRLRNKI